MAHTESSIDLSVANLFSVPVRTTVLVTGGASGLGEMAAQAFVQNGARVLIASRKKKDLEATTDRLNKLGQGKGKGKCEYIVADLKDKAGCEALVAEVKKRTDKLDVLINNSGATWGAPYDDFPESGWDKIMALNVKAIFYVTAGLDSLLTKDATANSPSRVINIASVAGISTADVTAGEDGGMSAPGSGTFSYGPSKAACIHLSKLQASKLMSRHVTVNCIAPGVFPSKMSAYGLREAGDYLRGMQPSGRVGKPEDFAGLVLFVASKGAAHITGNVFEIDGGVNLTGAKGKGKAKQAKL